MATKARYSHLDAPIDSDYTQDLLTQISIISKITKRKLRIFHFSATLLLLSMLAFLVPIGYDIYRTIGIVYE